MKILLVAAMLVVAAVGGCDGDNDDKATPRAGWSNIECSQARHTLSDLKQSCTYRTEGACAAAGQLQSDINDNCSSSLR